LKVAGVFCVLGEREKSCTSASWSWQKFWRCL